MPTPDAAPILLCFDCSEGARNAIRQAGALFGGRRALVLTIWDYPIEVAALGLAAAAAYSAQSERALALAHAEEGCDIARAAGLDPAPVVMHGTGEETSATILRVARERAAALIVVGARGLGDLRSLMLGSVSRGVVQHADRPVLVVPPGSGNRPPGDAGDRPVVVAYDGSDGASQAIATLALLGSPAPASVLSVWNAPVGMAAHGMAREADAYEAEQQRIASAHAAEGCRIARDAGLDPSPSTACGSSGGTARAILAVADARDARLIVVGARGLAGVRARLLGSISNAVVQHADRPVLVVPPA